MSRGKELIKNTGILFIAKISTQLVSFFLLPLYTGLLAVSEYGQIDIYASLSMILIPFITLQLEQGIFRFVISAKDRNETNRILSSSMVAILSTILVFTIVYMVINFIFPIRFAIILYFYYVTLALSTIWLQTSRGFGNNIIYGIASFLSSAIGIALNVVFLLKFHMNVKGILYASIIANLISTVYMVIATNGISYLRPKFIRINILTEMLKYSVPLIFNQISSWIINYSDRLIIMLFLGIESNGIYSLASKFSNLLISFFAVYNIAWTENVVRCIEDEHHEDYLNNIVTTTFKIYLCLVIGIINILPLIFKIMVNTNYSDAYLHIPILLMAMFFSGMAATLGSIYVARKKTVSVAITTFMGGVINAIVHLCFIKIIGLYAASISTLIAFLAMFIFRYIRIQRFEPVKFDFKSLWYLLTVLILSWYAFIVVNYILIIIGLFLNIVYLVYQVYKYLRKR